MILGRTSSSSVRFRSSKSSFEITNAVSAVLSFAVGCDSGSYALMAGRVPSATFESLFPVSQPQHSLGNSARACLKIVSRTDRGTSIG